MLYFEQTVWRRLTAYSCFLIQHPPKSRLPRPIWECADWEFLQPIRQNGTISVRWRTYGKTNKILSVIIDSSANKSLGESLLCFSNSLLATSFSFSNWWVNSLVRRDQIWTGKGYISFNKSMSAASDFSLRCSLKCRISPSPPRLREGGR